MKKTKYLLCAVFIISISFICSPSKIIAKIINDSEENNTSHTVANKPNDTTNTARTHDEKLLIYPKINCDPKMLIPGDPNIDPKFILKEYP